MSDKQDSKSFWTTVPGILTGCAALLTALGGLITALYAAGLLQTLFPSSVALPTATSIRPTATLVSLTQAVVTVTSSPQPTVPMTPTQPCPTPQFFENVWKAHPQLGCPVNSLTSDFVFEKFERGIMVWQKSPSPSTIYAFFNDGFWEKQPDPTSYSTCPEAQMMGRPVRGFGTLWCNNRNWRERIGQPTSDEQAEENKQIQNFQNGTILNIGAAGGFILYADYRWQPF